MKTIKMWNTTPGHCNEEPVLEYYKSGNKISDGTVIIFPGGGYAGRSPHEGKSYAEYLNSIGIDAFVLQYRVKPHHFPLQLLDARRAVRWVRYHASEYEINPKKISVMGSSAGGHLAAMVSTYKEKIEFENIDDIDKIDYLPNYQILAYPVIAISNLSVSHIASTYFLLGEENICIAPTVDPLLIADKKTPSAFIWHTSNDPTVNVKNSLLYGEKLRDLNVQFEMHIFPDGDHGLGLAQHNPNISQWSELLKKWLDVNGYYTT